ncbi:hypothetical protein TSUD_146100 [Trifolium subterraneum]|uniref:Uncharacterized protein n=1 Tax=Trifolium subterraneum TaxID=3900 RepID=A0A2Z6NN98_TRISU|nr:hypothetical protein TSUD_146100 [Trifolium subterraneum]
MEAFSFGIDCKDKVFIGAIYNVSMYSMYWTLDLCSHADTDLGGFIKDRMTELYFKSDLLKLE